MKIAIFENEYESVRFAFETANLIHFDKKLQFTVFPSSQSADINLINEYQVIFIDIDLSSRSILDGYGLIKKIIEKDLSLKQRLVILTGNNKITESLQNLGINSLDFTIIIKPTDYEEVSVAIKKIIDKLN